MKKLTTAQRKTIIQFLKFGTVGASGFVLDNIFVYFGIYILDFSRTGAGLFSFPFVATFTWLGNRLFTFHDAPRTNRRRQWAKFLIVCGVGLIFNRGTYSFLVNTTPMVYNYPVLGLLAGTAAAMFFNFFTAKKLVFR